PTEREAAHELLKDEREHEAYGEQNGEGDHAGISLLAGIAGGGVETGFKPADQAAHPHHGMADGVEELRRIAEPALGNEGERRDEEGHQSRWTSPARLSRVSRSRWD